MNNRYKSLKKIHFQLKVQNVNFSYLFLYFKLILKIIYNKYMIIDRI